MSKVDGDIENLRITRLKDNITEVSFIYYDGDLKYIRRRLIQLQLNNATIAKVVATALGQEENLATV